MLPIQGMAVGPAVNSIKHIRFCIKRVLKENQINDGNHLTVKTVWITNKNSIKVLQLYTIHKISQLPPTLWYHLTGEDLELTITFVLITYLYELCKKKPAMKNNPLHYADRGVGTHWL